MQNKKTPKNYAKALGQRTAQLCVDLERHVCSVLRAAARLVVAAHARAAAHQALRNDAQPAVAIAGTLYLQSK